MHYPLLITAQTCPLLLLRHTLSCLFRHWGHTFPRGPPSVQVLEKFEVTVPDDQLLLLDTLDAEWARFQSSLEDSGGKLEKHKDNFREKVGAQLICQGWNPSGDDVHLPGPQRSHLHSRLLPLLIHLPRPPVHGPLSLVPRSPLLFTASFLFQFIPRPFCLPPSSLQSPRSRACLTLSSRR